MPHRLIQIMDENYKKNIDKLGLINNKIAVK